MKVRASATIGASSAVRRADASGAGLAAPACAAISNNAIPKDMSAPPCCAGRAQIASPIGGTARRQLMRSKRVRKRLAAVARGSGGVHHLGARAVLLDRFDRILGGRFA